MIASDPESLAGELKKVATPESWILLDIDYTVIDGKGGLMDPDLPKFIKQHKNIAFLTARPADHDSAKSTILRLQQELDWPTKCDDCCIKVGNNMSCATHAFPLILTHGHSKGSAISRWFKDNNIQPQHVIFADDQDGYLQHMKRHLVLDTQPELTLIKMRPPKAPFMQDFFEGLFN